MKYRIEINQCYGDKSWLDSGAKPRGQAAAKEALERQLLVCIDKSVPRRIVVLVEGCEPSAIFVHDPESLIELSAPAALAKKVSSGPSAEVLKELAERDATQSDKARMDRIESLIAELKVLGVDHRAMTEDLVDTKERLGELDQSRSDNAFYMKKLFNRACEAYSLDPDSATWFEIIDRLEAVMRSAATACRPSKSRMSRPRRISRGASEELLAQLRGLPNPNDDRAMKGLSRRQKERVSEVHHFVWDLWADTHPEEGPFK